MSDVTSHPSSRAFWLSVAGIIGCFLVFAIVLYVAGIPGRTSGGTVPAFSPAELSELDKLAPAEREARMQEIRFERGLLTPAERTQRLSELRIKEDHALTSYQWIDKTQGTVRLPIERAMELVVRDAQAKK